MFLERNFEDGDLALVYNTASRWEAEMVVNILKEAGIESLVMDRGFLYAYLRIFVTVFVRDGCVCKLMLSGTGKETA